jgi:hypothetical protein
MISNSEFDAEVNAPFSYITVTHPTWRPSHRAIITKWLDVNSNGWVCFDGADLYIFEKTADLLFFKIWITGDPFEDSGEIKKQ